MATESTTSAPLKSRNKSPISSHPAFPAIVALWFAALLGIGSLIVPVVLFEKLATITGLSAIFPSAQPPLGVTARLIIALGATGIGVIAGLLLAHRVAAAQSEPAPQRFHGKKVPISALEELGAPSLDQPVDEPPFGRSLEADLDADIGPSSDESPLPGTQRRASLIASESASDEFVDYAPLPGVSDTISDTAANFVPDEDVSVAVEPDENDAPEDIAEEPAPLNAEQLINRPLNQLGIVHLVERFALSLQTKTPAEVLNTDTFQDAGVPDAYTPMASELADISTDETADPVSDSPTSLAQPVPAIPVAFHSVEDDGDLAMDEGENCSSLLDMKSALAAGLNSVRIDDSVDQEGEIQPRRFDPPHAVPATEPLENDAEGAKVSSAGAELALREALEKLQKMSGVG